MGVFREENATAQVFREPEQQGRCSKINLPYHVVSHRLNKPCAAPPKFSPLFSQPPPSHSRQAATGSLSPSAALTNKITLSTQSSAPIFRPARSLPAPAPIRAATTATTASSSRTCTAITT